eukprot:scaffold30857_cov45-Phaeocystis_antarctica.AAC.4
MLGHETIMHRQVVVLLVAPTKLRQVRPRGRAAQEALLHALVLRDLACDLDDAIRSSVIGARLHVRRAARRRRRAERGIRFLGPRRCGGSRGRRCGRRTKAAGLAPLPAALLLDGSLDVGHAPIQAA